MAETFLKKLLLPFSIILLVLAVNIIDTDPARSADTADTTDEAEAEIYAEPTAAPEPAPADSGTAPIHDAHALAKESMDVLPGLRIAVVSKNTKGEFWKELRNGMEEMIQTLNEQHQLDKKNRITMTFEGPSYEGDVNTQVNTLDAVLAENPDVLCLCASDMDSCLAQLESARENGIPVVTFDSNVRQTDLVYAFCASDNTAVGRIAAEQLAESLQYKGKVAVFSAQGKAQSIQDRVQAFQETLKAWPEIEIVRLLYMDEEENMKASISQTLEDYPDLAGVFCTNADSAELYLDTKKDPSEGIPPVLIGVDGTSAQQKAIRKGEEYGLVAQDAWKIGAETILLAVEAAAASETGGASHEDVLLDPAWIDATALEAQTQAEYLY